MVNLTNSYMMSCPVCKGSTQGCGGVDSHIEVIEEHCIEVEMEHYVQGVQKGLEMGVELVQRELERAAQSQPASAGVLLLLGRLVEMRARLREAREELMKDEEMEAGDLECGCAELCEHCVAMEAGLPCDCFVCRCCASALPSEEPLTECECECSCEDCRQACPVCGDH